VKGTLHDASKLAKQLTEIHFLIKNSSYLNKTAPQDLRGFVKV
jgi:hypothetical protein